MPVPNTMTPTTRRGRRGAAARRSKRSRIVGCCTCAGCQRARRRSSMSGPAVNGRTRSTFMSPRAIVTRRPRTAAPTWPSSARIRASSAALSPYASMEIHFLGGATTVTGSQFLLETSRARVLIDCGMFQGSPNESIRNRIPFAYDPAALDAVLLTHAHLDHCGLIPLLVKLGYAGKIHATAGTVELATLVLLDSGKLHEEFAKRDARFEARHPEKAAVEDAQATDQYESAIELAAAGDAIDAPERGGPPGAHPASSTAQRATTPGDPEADLRGQPPALEIDLDAP